MKKIKVEDYDYHKATNMDFREGYNKGRDDMLKECAAIVCVVGFLFWLF